MYGLPAIRSELLAADKSCPAGQVDEFPLRARFRSEAWTDPQRLSFE